MHTRIQKKREAIVRHRILAADEIVLRALDSFEDSRALRNACRSENTV
jgi:hypothetical protein